ncbi:unnamed protein product, partial [Musa acuminata var. zebrina]
PAFPTLSSSPFARLSDPNLRTPIALPMPEYSEAHRPLPPPTLHPCTPEGRPTLFADEVRDSRFNLGYVFAFIAKDSGVDEERAFGGADYTIAMVIRNVQVEIIVQKLKEMSTRMILLQLYLQVNNKVMVI